MNKLVVITGAGGVLCSCFAQAMAGAGYDIALLDINEEAAKLAAEEIKRNKSVKNVTVKAYKANVLDKDNLEEVHQNILYDLGKCSVLINGAGGNSPKCITAHEMYEIGDEKRNDVMTFFNLDKTGFDFVFNLNLMGTLLPTQVFAADMLGREGCSIVNISSMNAYKPLTKIPAYSAANSAVSNFTQWLAVHFAKENIRVNAIAPGFFVTKQNQDLLFDKEGNPTERTEKILRATPMNRFGKPEELIGTLLWITDSKASGFVTGIVVPVDGGFSAYSGV